MAQSVVILWSKVQTGQNVVIANLVQFMHGKGQPDKIARTEC
jgi:hypothetical protein